jgi:hypothetical protein
MKKVGHKKLMNPQHAASGQLLRRGCELNDALHELPTGNTTWFPKGIYRYKSAIEANRHWDECVAKGIASQLSKSNKKQP